MLQTYVQLLWMHGYTKAMILLLRDHEFIFKISVYLFTLYIHIRVCIVVFFIEIFINPFFLLNNSFKWVLFLIIEGVQPAFDNARIISSIIWSILIIKFGVAAVSAGYPTSFPDKNMEKKERYYEVFLLMENCGVSYFIVRLARNSTMYAGCTLRITLTNIVELLLLFWMENYGVWYYGEQLILWSLVSEDASFWGLIWLHIAPKLINPDFLLGFEYMIQIHKK